MKHVLINTLMNLAGKGVVALSTLLALPVHLHLLGAEACGIMGFFNSFLVLATIFDLGIGAAVNRTLARMSFHSVQSQEMGDLFVTLEIIYWLLGLAIGCTLALLAKPMALYWFSAEETSAATIQRAISLMGISVSIYWPYIFYSNGLMGLQQQARCNLILVVMTLIRVIGGLCCLYYISCSLEAFFLWQIGTFFLQTLWTRIALRQKLMQLRHGRFRLEALLHIKGFALGVAALSVTSVILMQADKIILSKTLQLSQYGIYILINALAAGIVFLGSPVFLAFFPALSASVAQKNRRNLKSQFMQGSSIMATMVLPVLALFAFFPKEILQLWLGSHYILGPQESLTFILLSIGYGCNALVVMPYALQLAYGWTRLNFIQNCVALSLLIPLLIVFSYVYEGAGAASCWCILNVGYCLIGMQFVFQRILREQKWKWYMRGILLPGSVSFLTAWASRWIMIQVNAPIIISLTSCYFCMLGFTLLISHKQLALSDLYVSNKQAKRDG